jgi:lysophospholipase L1-like esterase
MYRIMCFGDSNTWGFIPVSAERYDRQTRWTQVMASALGEQYEVVEEGMNGRTTVWDDPVDGLMSGLEYLKPCLISQKPLDKVLVMLGTNDLKDRFGVTAPEIAKSAGRLVRMIQSSDAGPNGSAPKVVLMAPPPIVAGPDGFGLRQAGLVKSQGFAESFAAMADELGCEFLNTGDYIESSPLDGIHFSAEAHRTLGAVMAKFLLESKA